MGLVDLVQQAGAEVAGVGICIEKSFQPGHQLIEDSGIDIYSICRIASLENEEVTFLKEIIKKRTLITIERFRNLLSVIMLFYYSNLIFFVSTYKVVLWFV